MAGKPAESYMKSLVGKEVRFKEPKNPDICRVFSKFNPEGTFRVSYDYFDTHPEISKNGFSRSIRFHDANGTEAFTNALILNVVDTKSKILQKVVKLCKGLFSS